VAQDRIWCVPIEMGRKLGWKRLNRSRGFDAFHLEYDGWPRDGDSVVVDVGVGGSDVVGD
jgi:hypothetical protein